MKITNCTDQMIPEGTEVAVTWEPALDKQGQPYGYCVGHPRTRYRAIHWQRVPGESEPGYVGTYTDLFGMVRTFRVERLFEDWAVWFDGEV